MHICRATEKNQGKIYVNITYSVEIHRAISTLQCSVRTEATCEIKMSTSLKWDMPGGGHRRTYAPLPKIDITTHYTIQASWRMLLSPRNGY